MKKDMFKEQMRETFNSEVPDVLQKIKSSEQFKVPTKDISLNFFQRIFSKNSNSEDVYRNPSYFQNVFTPRRSISFASILIIAIVGILALGSRDTAQVYASTVTLDINPSIEIRLDEEDLVMSVVGLNNDGIIVVDAQLQYRKMTLDQVIEKLIERLDELGYIIEGDDENILLISVESDSENRRTQLKDKIETRVSFEAGRYNKAIRVLKSDEYELTNQQIQNLVTTARNNGISPNKLIYIYRIKEIDVTDDYTIRELAGKSMRELYKIEQDILNPDRTQGNGSGNGN